MMLHYYIHLALKAAFQGKANIAILQIVYKILLQDLYLFLSYTVTKMLTVTWSQDCSGKSFSLKVFFFTKWSKWFANYWCVMSQIALVKLLVYTNLQTTVLLARLFDVKINSGSVFRRHEPVQSHSLTVHHRGSRLGSGSLCFIPCGDPLKSHMSRGQLNAECLLGNFTLSFPHFHSLTFFSWFYFVHLFFCLSPSPSVLSVQTLHHVVPGLTVGRWIEKERYTERE